MSDGQPHLVPPPERRCRFVKTNGARCTMPSLHRHDLCFDHAYRVRVVRGNAKRIKREEPYMVPLITYNWVEDHHAILRNLNEISQQLANGAINHRQAHAFILLQRTLLKTIRQMKEIQQVETPVEDFVEEDGVTLAVPDNDAAGQPIDRTADPDRPTLSFDPDTDEGRRNQKQKLLWEYFSADPASGVPYGVDIDWPGRPAGFVPPNTSAAQSDTGAAPPPASASPENCDAPDLPAPCSEQERISDQQESVRPWAAQPSSVPVLLLSQPAPDSDATACLTLQAVADPLCVTPAESANISPEIPLNPLYSTLAPILVCNPCPSHTYAKFEFFPGRVKIELPPESVSARP
ncbi:MAG: hypothetical protein WA294_20280 [Acidobacteriaceae bacterium]